MPYFYKYLSDMFPIQNGLKQGDTLAPLLFNFALEQWYSTFSVRVPPDIISLQLCTPSYKFSSTLYPQSCWCIIQVIHSLHNLHRKEIK
jgi:hypothetical protein